MSAVVPPHVDVAVRRPAHVAGKVVAERWEGLPTILAGEPLLRQGVRWVGANQWSACSSGARFRALDSFLLPRRVTLS
jgi:hypothetical protein